MTIQQKNITISLLKAILKICIAGFFIGFFHKHDKIIAFVLLFKVVHSMYSLGFKNKQKRWMVPTGMVLTGIIGIVGESIGTSNGYWRYHDVNTLMPLWLPFAWMLAFSYVYKLEKELFTALNNPALKIKTFIAFLLALIFPAFGEVITINLGVWTYSWPYQLWGVPLYAFICLVVIHLSINAFAYGMAHKLNIKDPVFNP